MKYKKYFKILIVIILSCILIGVFYLVKPQIGVIQKGPKALSEKNVKVSLKVLNKTYDVNIKEGSTVYDAMNIAQSLVENNFSFKSKEYPSLGIFVGEINGKKGGEGGYWIYSVNGEEANVGVSNYKVNNGDIISWKYEK
jgi:hypothetical protein